MYIDNLINLIPVPAGVLALNITRPLCGTVLIKSFGYAIKYFEQLRM